MPKTLSRRTCLRGSAVGLEQELMSQPNIVILDAEERQQVGVQVKGILRRQGISRVDLRGGLSRGRIDGDRIAPRLLIPVLPLAWRSAAQLLVDLRLDHAQIPLLPVISPEALSEGFDDRLASAQDFLVTPLREAEVCVRVRRLTGLTKAIATKASSEACGLAQLIGEDPSFVGLKRQIVPVARFESTVLLTGETGTGKERFARALHYSSRRSDKPFLAVNCGAIPVDLLESELYGHLRGAFTGAVAAQPGLIAEAENGTLFLDEIESLSLGSQVKLLRFLQDQTYYPVGSAKPRQANVWIIASTNVELPAMIQARTFREDLFYRLAVINLALPPLRERKRDIPLLAAHFWKMHAGKAGRSGEELSGKVVEALCQYSWPGNIRELGNVVQQLAVLSESETVRPEDLLISRLSHAVEPQRGSFAQRKAGAIEEFERGYITELLRLHQGNVTRAAQEARKDRRALGRLIKKYQITTEYPV